MDYTRKPVSALLLGPLIHTPQGLVVVSASVLYFLAALIFGLTDITPPFSYSSGKAVAICIGWPIFLFMFYIKSNLPDFESSWSQTGMLVFGSVVPVLYPLWKHLT
jgi:hypothetical protein